MSEFWKTPIGKILGYGVHEHSNGLAVMGTNLSILENKIKAGQYPKELLGDVEAMRAALKRCREAMDYVYKNIKGANEDV